MTLVNYLLCEYKFVDDKGAKITFYAFSRYRDINPEKKEVVVRREDILDASQFGGARQGFFRLKRANLFKNKALIKFIDFNGRYSRYYVERECIERRFNR
jgi:hypothetical protein